MTVNPETQYDGLSTREGFNTSLRHFQYVSTLIGDLEGNVNLADLVNEAIADKSLQTVQIKPILNALLVDRYGYHFSSHNIMKSVEDFAGILEEAQKWTSVDLVIVYYSPELGLTLVNPKNPDHWSHTAMLR